MRPQELWNWSVADILNFRKTLKKTKAYICSMGNVIVCKWYSSNVTARLWWTFANGITATLLQRWNMTLPHWFGPLMLPPFPPMCFIIHIKICCEYVAGFEIKVQRRLSIAQNIFFLGGGLHICSYFPDPRNFWKNELPNKVVGRHCHAQIPLNYCNVKNIRHFLFWMLCWVQYIE